MVKALDSQSRVPNPGCTFQNHWVVPRLTQPFIFLGLIKWVPDISRNLLVKSNLPPQGDSVALRHHLVHNWLSNRKQWTKINSSYSSLLEIIFGVPQGSILLSNIFLIDLFFIIEDTDIASYANDNTPYFSVDNIDGVITFLEEAP